MFSWSEWSTCPEGSCSHVSFCAMPVLILTSILFPSFTLFLYPSSQLLLCPPGSPHPPTPASHKPPSALGLLEVLSRVTFGKLHQVKEIPVTSARAAGLLGFPLAHSDASWLDITGLQDWVGFCGFICSLNHCVIFLWYGVFFGLRKYLIKTVWL